jgi:hypothetical protein
MVRSTTSLAYVSIMMQSLAGNWCLTTPVCLARLFLQWKLA